MLSQADEREVDAERAGRLWADEVRGAIRLEGRAAAGGWPGTLTEARSRVMAVLRGRLPAEAEELDRLTRLLYSAARRHWLADRDASPPDD